MRLGSEVQGKGGGGERGNEVALRAVSGLRVLETINCRLGRWCSWFSSAERGFSLENATSYVATGGVCENGALF